MTYYQGRSVTTGACMGGIAGLAGFVEALANQLAKQQGRMHSAAQQGTMSAPCLGGADAADDCSPFESTVLAPLTSAPMPAHMQLPAAPMASAACSAPLPATKRAGESLEGYRGQLQRQRHSSPSSSHELSSIPNARRTQAMRRRGPWHSCGRAAGCVQRRRLY